MADEVQVTQSTETTPNTGAAPESAPKTEADHSVLESLSAEELRKEVLNLRRSEAAFRTKAKKADEFAAQLKAEQDKKAEEARQADLTEAQKLKEALEAETAKRTALENKMRDESINVGLMTVLTAKGLKAHRIDDVFQFADRSAIAADSTGKLTGFDAVIDALQADRPYLFDSGKPAVSGLPGAGPAIERAPGLMSNADLMAATRQNPNSDAFKAAKAELKKRGVI